MQEKLFGSTKYIGNSYNTFDFTLAQAEFVKSKYTSKRYAMLVDGVWWENEADNVFKSLETIRGEKKSDRHFGFLPIPKADESKLGAQTLFSANSSFGFINKNTTNMELAKEFMRFLHTDEEMARFTAKTSIPRAFNYTVDSAIRDTATSFGQSVIDMKNASEIVYPYSSTSLIVNNAASFTEAKWFMTSSVGGRTLENPFSAFENGTANALQYFNGLYTYQQNAWKLLKR
jgi:ABC-type glycerol-3-phosphate transport system substrate-binding protein